MTPDDFLNGVNPYRRAKAHARAQQIFASLNAVETRSYTEYVRFLKGLRLKSGPPQIDSYEEWARMWAKE